MSLILDALNRAENERKNQNAVPDLNTLHRPQTLNVESRGRPILLWITGAVLVAIIIALVILLRREPAGSPISVEKVIPVHPSVAVPESNSVVMRQSSAQPISTAVPVKTPSVAETASQTSAPSADVNKLYATGDTESPAPIDTGVNELYAAEAATTAASEPIIDPFNVPGNTSGSASIPTQEQAPPRTFDSIKNIPDFNALPWNMRQQIPTISYARHNYLAGGVSSVVINNQTTGVGNIIGTGQFIVQEIYVDGVVLKHGNAVFKLRALTGWINM